MPVGATALVLAVHPDASSQGLDGHRFVADVLSANRIATLSFSLTTPGQVISGAGFCGDEAMQRVLAVLDGVECKRAARGVHVALLGVGPAVASCIHAAASLGPRRIGSLILLDGHRWLTAAAIGRLRVPTLLIAGGADPMALARYCSIAAAMRAAHRVEMLPLAAQPRAQSGAYEAIACTVANWLDERLYAEAAAKALSPRSRQPRMRTATRRAEAD